MSVRNALLGLIEQHPRHGYDLAAAFLALVGGPENWDLKPGQVYTTLGRLEEAGLICVEGQGQDGGPEKTIYTITPSGRQELVSWMSMPVKTAHQRDEFFLKLMVALATGDADPHRLIYTQRGSLYQQLHDLTGQHQAADPHSELALILLLEQAIMHLEADLRWLDMVESRLDEIRRQPVPQPETRPRGRPPKGKSLSNN